jgi:hypothetical protein
MGIARGFTTLGTIRFEDRFDYATNDRLKMWLLWKQPSISHSKASAAL